MSSYPILPLPNLDKYSAGQERRRPWLPQHGEVAPLTSSHKKAAPWCCCHLSTPPILNVSDIDMPLNIVRFLTTESQQLCLEQITQCQISIAQYVGQSWHSREHGSDSTDETDGKG